MDMMNYLISITLLALIVSFGEFWMGVAAAAILIVATRESKATILIIIGMIAFYYISMVGMKDYWLIALLGLVMLGYLIGVDKSGQAQPADPYAGLMGGMGGMDMGGGMGGMM
ncbi:MAG: hypothetical protein PHQ98_03280 [Candidatus ainarchaeum sp.]|nr:hypothetical protein [Candidatus ainarchaeum sp.]